MGILMKFLLLAVVAVSAGSAQSLTEPPPLIRFDRRQGTASVRPYSDTGAHVNVVGIASVTGRPETWLIELHDSFASIEDVDKSLRSMGPFGAISGQEASGDILGDARTFIGTFRPGFSYRPEQATEALRKARYCQVSIYHVQSGHEAEFAELVKSRRILFDSINLDRPDLAYYVLSGATSGTFIFLAPLTSLKILDDAMAKAPAYAESIAAEGSKSRGFTREYLLFRMEPGASFVSEEFAAGDPEFWHGKSKTQ